MKEITKEHKTTYTVYQAVDGTEFNTKEECEQYENSARGVLRGKLKSLTVNDIWNGWDLMGGNDDHQIIAVKVPDDHSIDIILQNYYLDQPWILRESNICRRENFVNVVHQAYKEQDVVLFGINCEGELYFIDTRNNIINRLNALDKGETKDE